MDHNKSHTDMLKAANDQVEQRRTEDVLMDMLINEAQLTYAYKKLRKQIDQALDDRDEELFMKLSTELITVEKNLRH